MAQPELLTKVDRYVADFAALEQQNPPLLEARRAAMERFKAAGFPWHKKVEDWRNTDLAPLAAHEYALAPSIEPSADDIAAIQSLLFDIEGGARLVFVNGELRDELSSLGDLPAGVKLGGVATALRNNDATVVDRLNRRVGEESHAFAQLNIAFMSDGAALIVPKGVKLERPAQIVHYTLPTNDTPVAAHPRNLIVLEEGAEATVIETHAGADGAPYLNNAVTEIEVGDGANLTHIKLQRESDTGFNMAWVRGEQGADSNFAQFNIGVGSRLNRNDIGSRLSGENGHCDLFGLYIPRDEQHIDTHSWLDHAVPNCTSEELYKGVLDGHSSGVFNGKIDVRKDAQKTDAIQSNHALILSRDAKINTRPQLEIYADDVKCTHGATIGEVDELALYYLQTRGISGDKARAMMIMAFASEVMERVECEPVHDWLQQYLSDRFLG